MIHTIKFRRFSFLGLHFAYLCRYFAHLCVITLYSLGKNYAEFRNENAKFRKEIIRKSVNYFLPFMKNAYFFSFNDILQTANNSQHKSIE